VPPKFGHGRDHAAPRQWVRVRVLLISRSQR